MIKSITCLGIVLFTLTLQGATHSQEMIVAPLRNQVLELAKQNVLEQPVTITAYKADRSAGGIHDFYSEGDYWWPDPKGADLPYIRRDGETNPDNFVAHHHAMIKFSMIVGNLTSAYLLTGDKKYVDAVVKQVRAWFTSPATMMNPNLMYAQAIKGVSTGRGIGIIDTIHLVEVAQSLLRLHQVGVLPKDVYDGCRKWFADYLSWMTTHKNGRDEMKATNNHGTCWAVQAAMFAKFTGKQDIMRFCSDRFKKVFIVNQMDSIGGFHQELARTKPYGYSLFNLDAMAALCQILSVPEDNLWTYTTPDGRNMQLAIQFMYPYIMNKNSWPYPHDVMYWGEWPVAQPSYIFAWANFGDQRYYNAWKQFNHFPTNEEVIRNLPLRNPIIWLVDGPRGKVRHNKHTIS